MMRPALLRGATGRAEARLPKGWGGDSEAHMLSWAPEGQQGAVACGDSNFPRGHDFLFTETTVNERRRRGVLGYSREA